MSELSPSIWEQQPRESPRAFGAFCAYRDLGPRRSLRAAAEKFYQRSTAAVLRQCNTWSKAFRWVERASAWDRHLDAQTRQAQVEARCEMADRHVRVSRGLQTKAVERLRALRPEELGPADVLRYLVEATKLERLAMGEPDAVQRQELTGPGGGPVRFCVEDVVKAIRELEAEDDHLQRDGGKTPRDGSPEVP